MKRLKKTILDALRDPDSNNAQEDLEQERKTSLQLDQREIYLEHRIFLDNYKKQKQQPALKQQGSHAESEKIQSQRMPEAEETVQQLEQEEHRKNVESIEQRMQDIHSKLQVQMQQKSCEDRNKFKIFTDIVEHKKDIDRISKERSFIKSQTSNCFKYQEPKISSPMKLHQRQRFFTQAIGVGQLNKQAKQFSERVQKEQEILWGNHLLARRIEERKRDLVQTKEQQQCKLQRQMRVLEKYKNQKEQHFQRSQVLEKQERQDEQSSRDMLRASRDERVLKRYLTESKGKQVNACRIIETSRIIHQRQRSSTDADPIFETEVQESESVQVPRTSKLRKKIFSRQMPQSRKDQNLNQISVKLHYAGRRNQIKHTLTHSQQFAQPNSYIHTEQDSSSEFSSPLPRLLVKHSQVIISTHQRSVTDDNDINAM